MTRSPIIFLITVLLFKGIPIFGSPDQTLEMRLVMFDRPKILDILEPLHLGHMSIREVKRNSDGTKLFVTLCGTGTNADNVAVISPTGIHALSTPGIFPNVTDDGSVASFGENFSTFIFGTSISYSNFNYELCFSPGCAFYCAMHHTYAEHSQASIYQTRKPQQPLVRLEESFWPTGMYALNKLVDVEGYFYPPANRPHNHSGRAWTLIRFRVSATNSLEEYARIPMKGTVVDVDQRDQVLLARTFSDFFPSWYLFNMGTGKRHRVGKVCEYALFLDPSLAKMFDRK